MPAQYVIKGAADCRVANSVGCILFHEALSFTDKLFHKWSGWEQAKKKKFHDPVMCSMYLYPCTFSRVHVQVDKRVKS